MHSIDLMKIKIYVVIEYLMFKEGIYEELVVKLHVWFVYFVFSNIVGLLILNRQGICDRKLLNYCWDSRNL